MSTKPHWSEDVVAHGLGGLKRLSGYYHENFVAEHEGANYLIRIPRSHSKDMDFRQFDERHILRFLETHGFPSPKLLYESALQGFSVHEFVSGTPLNELYPKSKALAPAFIQEIAVLMNRLHALPVRELITHARVQHPISTNDFFASLLDDASKFYLDLWRDAPNLFSELDFPSDPIAPLRRYIGTLANRPLVLCHTDMHQLNFIVSEPEKKLVVLDWELSRIGDRLYDIATHVNRSYYSRPQVDQFVYYYNSSLPADISSLSLRRDLEAYLDAECVRSVISDAYRLHTSEQRPNTTDETKYKRDVRFPDLMQKARKVWAEQ